MPRGEAEQVILVNEQGAATGVALKSQVHGTDTPLHLAFSCYVFDEEGRLLVTQRALTKVTWPGVWTNSCCGHPKPGESLTRSVRRRLDEELGLQVSRLDIVLPRFRYRAVMDDGIVENEICPVYRAVATDQPRLAPEEVADATWEPWADFSTGVIAGTRDISPWCREQVPALVALGPDPLAWPASHADELPPAARPQLLG